MIKKINTLLLSFLLIIFCFTTPAYSLSKEEMYQAGLTELKNHLNGDTSIPLETLSANFDALGQYQMSINLYFYTQALENIESESFGSVTYLIDLLKLDPDFSAFLEEHELGSLEEMENYAAARKAQSNGHYTDAMDYFRQCIGFGDSMLRYEKLQTSLLDKKYMEAINWYNQNSYEGYQKAYTLFLELAGYDYEDSSAYLRKADALRSMPAPTDISVPSDANVITDVKSASAPGFAGPVYVEVTLDAEGKIATLNVGDDTFNETPGFGSKARDEAFTKQFIGKVPPLKFSDIDTISSATITSEAVVNAINAACTGEKTEEKPAAEGVLSASAQGYAGPVYVEITLDAEGKIASLKVGDDTFNETPGFGGKARDEAFTKQFIGKVPPLKFSDIDTISSATITSEAVVNAINAAYQQ